MQITDSLPIKNILHPSAPMGILQHYIKNIPFKRISIYQDTDLNDHGNEYLFIFKGELPEHWEQIQENQPALPQYPKETDYVIEFTQLTTNNHYFGFLSLSK